ncbi:MAG: hypothetical protein U9P14_05125 [Gemmatimonadota bacterium]|nr:hypothetical protein [Gemmatimonadota bacterium]
MAHRERGLSTLNHEKPDRRPMQISFIPEFADRLTVKLGIGIITIPLLAIFMTGASCTSEKTPIKVGFAQQEIATIGINKPDYSFHDTLYAKVIWVEDKVQPFGIVTLDMIEVTDAQTAAIKKSISDSLGIPGVRVTVCPSHNHSGTGYEDRILAQRIGSIARKARQSARPAQVAYSRVEVGPGFVVNRRVTINEKFGDLTMVYYRNYKRVDGGQKLDVRDQVIDFIVHGAQIYGTHYAEVGVLNRGDLAKASPSSRALYESLPPAMTLDGPVDPHLEALCFREQSGEIIGTLLRFACHSTLFRSSWSKQYSADYPGVLTSEVSKATGGAPAHFAQGPCGNTQPFSEDYGEDFMVDFGTRLARLITQKMERAEFAPLTKTYWNRETHAFACAPDMAGITEEIRESTAEDFNRMAAAPFDPYELKKAHDWSVRTWASQFASDSDTLRLPFTVIGFNQVAMVTMPGEIFAQHGLAIKSRFPGKNIMVIELTDSGSPLYVPTRDAFPRGGYEVSSSALPAGAGEQMVEICGHLLKGFYE